MNREQWLAKAYELIGERIFAPAEVTFNPDVHVSVGWPSSRGTSTKNRTIGQCWAGSTSEDEQAHIFISPVLVGELPVLETLVHEAVHAADHCASGHKGFFRSSAKAVGLAGKMTCTTSGPELRAKLLAIGDELGSYPHAAISPGSKSGHPKQTTRMLKVECPDCGYVLRTTQKWLDVGVPTCPCGTLMDAPW